MPHKSIARSGISKSGREENYNRAEGVARLIIEAQINIRIQLI